MRAQQAAGGEGAAQSVAAARAEGMRLAASARQLARARALLLDLNAAVQKVHTRGLRPPETRAGMHRHACRRVRAH